MRELTIQEFVPSLDTLKSFMERDPNFAPPGPTKEDLELQLQLKNNCKQLLTEYKQEVGNLQVDDDLMLTPRAINIKQQIRKAQIQLMQLNSHIDSKFKLQEFHRYVQILIKHNLRPLLETFFSPLNNGVPSITYFLLKYDDVSHNIADPDDFVFFRKFDIIPFIVTKRPVTLKLPVQIPPYNLLHIGNICHFNSCINMLSSLTLLIADLSKLRKSEKLSPIANNIFQYLLNAYSCIDLNPSLLLKIISTLHISLSAMEEATETMKKIISALYSSGIELTNTFFWDSTDKFYKQKEMNHSLSTKLTELKPCYFLCNIHDFNSVYGIDSSTIELQSFDITDENGENVTSYTLTSFIMFSNNHYVCAFIKPSQRKSQSGDPTFDVEIRNDIQNRYASAGGPIEYAFKGYQHVLGCYTRSDLLDVSQIPAPNVIEPIEIKPVSD